MKFCFSIARGRTFLKKHKIFFYLEKSILGVFLLSAGTLGITIWSCLLNLIYTLSDKIRNRNMTECASTISRAHHWDFSQFFSWEASFHKNDSHFLGLMGTTFIFPFKCKSFHFGHFTTCPRLWWLAVISLISLKDLLEDKCVAVQVHEGESP